MEWVISSEEGYFTIFVRWNTAKIPVTNRKWFEFPLGQRFSSISLSDNSEKEPNMVKINHT